MFKRGLVSALLISAFGAANAIVLYDSVPGPYSAYAATTGLIGFDDYDANIAQPKINMTAFKFVGGVNVANKPLIFEFYKADGATFVNGFSVTLPQAGNFIWTISGFSSFVIDSKGVVAMYTDPADTSYAARWFLTPTAPTVGLNDTDYGAAPKGSMQAFAIEGEPVPEPMTMLVLGAGLAAVARRRKA